MQVFRGHVRWRLTVVLLWGVAGPTVACSTRERTQGDTTSAAATLLRHAPPAVPTTAIPTVPLGDSIFHGQAAGGICYTCHGGDAKGTQLAPNLTDAEWLNGDGSEAFIIKTVTNGVPKPKKYPGAMPAFGQSLTPEQVQAVAAYVYSLRHPSP